MPMWSHGIEILISPIGLILMIIVPILAIILTIKLYKKVSNKLHRALATIAITIITIVVFMVLICLFGASMGHPSPRQTIDIEEVRSINSFFEPYEGADKYMDEIKSLLSKVKVHNEYYQDSYKYLAVKIKGIKDEENLSSNMHYDVSFDYNDDGYIKTIKIEEHN